MSDARRLNPASQADRDTAWLILDSARRAPTPGWFGERKVFVSAAYDQLRKDGRSSGISLPEFKALLVDLHRAGVLELARADLVAAMDPSLVAASEIDAQGAEFHFIVVDPAVYQHSPTGYVQNPAWVTQHLAASWVTLEDKVPPQWMPRLDRTRRQGKALVAEIPEYGCGAYGCVMPTLDPKIVLKLTTDETEAEFAGKLAKDLPVPICTIYHLVLRLPSARRQGRKVYLLWREAADDVGKIDKVVGQHAEQAIDAQHKAAQAAYELLVKGASAEGALTTWQAAVGAMGKVPELAWLADGMLRAFAERGIFFGDIHGGNLGRARGQWVITDPGHVAVVNR